MSAYVTTHDLSPAYPNEIYDGPRVGNAFGMSDATMRTGRARGWRDMGSIQEDLRSVIGAAAGEAVQSVEIRSHMSPPITIDRPLGAPGVPPRVSGGTPFTRKVLEFIKPEMIVRTPAGVFSIKPYGQPTENYALPIALGVLAAVGVGTYVTAKLAQRLLC